MHQNTDAGTVYYRILICAKLQFGKRADWEKSIKEAKVLIRL